MHVVPTLRSLCGDQWRAFALEKLIRKSGWLIESSDHTRLCVLPAFNGFRAFRDGSSPRQGRETTKHAKYTEEKEIVGGKERLVSDLVKAVITNHKLWGTIE